MTLIMKSGRRVPPLVLLNPNSLQLPFKLLLLKTWHWILSGTMKMNSMKPCGHFHHELLAVKMLSLCFWPLAAPTTWLVISELFVCFTWTEHAWRSRGAIRLWLYVKSLFIFESNQMKWTKKKIKAYTLKTSCVKANLHVVQVIVKTFWVFIAPCRYVNTNTSSIYNTNI